MTRLDLLIAMEKQATPAWLTAFKNTPAMKAIGSGWSRFTHNPTARNIGSGALGLMGLSYAIPTMGGLAQGASDLAYKGPMGIGAREKWMHEQREGQKAYYTPEQVEAARKQKMKGGLIGGGVGVLGGALALAKNKPLLALAAPILGWSTGRTISQNMNQAADPNVDPINVTLGEYRGIMSEQQANAWRQALESPELADNPRARAQLIGQYQEIMESDPRVKAYRKRQKTAKTVGGVLGGLGMGALMLFGSKKGLKPDATKFQKLIGGGGMAPWVGLAAGTAGMGALTALEGGRRAGIPKEEYRRRALEQTLADTGQNLMFYGMGFSPNWRKAIRQQ